jgi:hypothetical protein
LSRRSWIFSRNWRRYQLRHGERLRHGEQLRGDEWSWSGGIGEGIIPLPPQPATSFGIFAHHTIPLESLEIAQASAVHPLLHQSGGAAGIPLEDRQPQK